MIAQLPEFIILLGAALLFVILFRRIGLGAVLGYLIAGALVGPHGLGWVGGGEEKLSFAEFGIALLLFLIGMELNPARLWRLRREIFELGLAQVVLSAVALIGFLLLVTDFTWQAAVALAMPLALSSTAQVLPGLKSTGRINSPFGERAFSILLFQDLSIVPLITIIAALSRAPADPAAPPGWQMALYTLGAIVALVLAGRFLLHPLLRIIGGIGERELFVVVGLFAVLASAGLMSALHLSTALGAFIAGVMLADSPYRHELEADVEPFRSILLGLFFLAVGMQLDVGVVLARPWAVIGLAAGLVAIKTLVLWGLAYLAGMRDRSALALALLLSQGGEFGFVLFSQAQAALLIEPAAASLFGAVVTLSMATTPFLMLIVRALEYAQPTGDTSALATPDQAARAKAIVVGYGRFGQIVSQMLYGADVAVTLIDKKPAQIELSGRFDIKVYYGDGLRIDVLRQAGADQAELIAFCLDDKSMSATELDRIRQSFPQARLLVRVYDRRQYMAVHSARPDGIVRETFGSAMAMGRMALESLAFKDDEITDVSEAVRKTDAARLGAQLDSGDLGAGADLRFGEGEGRRPREVLDRLADLLSRDRDAKAR